MLHPLEVAYEPINRRPLTKGHASVCSPLMIVAGQKDVLMAPDFAANLSDRSNFITTALAHGLTISAGLDGGPEGEAVLWLDIHANGPLDKVHDFLGELGDCRGLFIDFVDNEDYHAFPEHTGICVGVLG